MTQIYLVRHAHANWSRDDGRSLSAAGFEAADGVAERLSGLPLAAIYSSPHRRVIETVTPLADRLAVPPRLVADLRERDLPAVPVETFEQVVENSWRTPQTAIDGGESNAAAQKRGLAVIRNVIAEHEGEHVVLATHGTLLALMLNGFDSAYGYNFWRQLSFPDIYCVAFQGLAVTSVQRMWDDGYRKPHISPISRIW